MIPQEEKIYSRLPRLLKETGAEILTTTHVQHAHIYSSERDLNELHTFNPDLKGTALLFLQKNRHISQQW